MATESHPPDEPGPGSQSSLRQANTARVLDALRFHGATTQADLARRTALAPSTVSGIIRELSEGGLVRVEEEHGGRRGRLVDLAVEGRVLVGVDIGHAHLKIGVASLAREILGERYERLDLNHSHGPVLTRARELLDDILRERHLSAGAIEAVGLALPAPIVRDGDRATVGTHAILPGWAEIDLVSVASDALGAPVVVDNDANAGALAEQRWGAGQGLASIAYIKIGHGVGAGLVLNGELYRGSEGVSGEIGHTVMDEHGIFCRCGGRGCLETVVNAAYLVAQIKPARPEIDTLEQLIAAAHAGDAACSRLIGDAGRYAGMAAAGLCNILNPDALIVGGGLAAAGDLLIDPFREAIQRFGIPSAVSRVKIMPTQFAENTHLVGALVLAMDAAAAIAVRTAPPRG